MILRLKLALLRVKSSSLSLKSWSLRLKSPALTAELAVLSVQLPALRAVEGGQEQALSSTSVGEIVAGKPCKRSSELGWSCLPSFSKKSFLAVTVAKFCLAQALR